MKKRSYDFSNHVRKGPMATKQQIVESLQAFAKEKRATSFTRKEFDAWPKKILGASQISHRFGSWPQAMERAGFIPKWSPTKNPEEMVEIFMDCWEKHDDCPTDKALTEYLRKIDSPYTTNIYKRYFGGFRRLAKRIADFHANNISEKQLFAKYEPDKKRRSPLPQSVRYAVLKRDGFKCSICGKTPKDDKVKLEVDHIIAVSAGGTDDIDNLRATCDGCNRGKGAKE